MRELIIALLDDEHGISYHAWQLLVNVVLESGEENFDDIADAVKMQDNRVYLPENWNK